MVRHAVILAGGAGTRLWPASTEKHPKQFLDLAQGRSLFALTLERAVGLGIEGFICVVTHRDHARAISRQCAALLRKLPFPANRIVILPEPQARNTAPAIALACCFLKAQGSEGDTLLVMPADHTVSPSATFAEDVETAERLAAEGWLVTFGITPERPETGYGYVEIAGRLAGGFKAARFKEKPDIETARAFLRRGGHYWNSGMFAFRVDRFLGELERHAPEVAKPFLFAPLPGPPATAQPGNGPVFAGAEETLASIYRQTPGISIDYALMERSNRCAVVPARFSWSDVGSWDVVAELFGPELAEGQARDLVSVQAAGNFVFSDIPVALAGVEDLVVVVKNGALLICRRGQTQLVREVVQALRDAGREDLL